MTTRKKLSFPRQFARTQRFSLGAPRSFTVSPDGSRVVYIRSSSGTDRSGRLWVLDLDGGRGAEREAADPAALLGGADERLSDGERARRERSREAAAGIVGYALDGAAELAVFALSGRLFTAALSAGTTRELPARAPVADPRPSPDGRLVAYASGGSLRIVGADGGNDRALAEPEEKGVSYGVAEFVAAEEMGRSRGHWWSPDSDGLLVTRVDEREVARWWIGDGAHPDREPRPVAYPAAGTANAEVRLFHLTLEGERTEIVWDRSLHPYLARVLWTDSSAPLLLVQSRDQRSQLFLSVDTKTGGTHIVEQESDPVWLDLFPGVPSLTPAGELVRITEEDGARVLAVGGRILTGPSLHPRAVLAAGPGGVLFSASAGAEASDPEIGEIHVYRAGPDGAVERISGGPGVHAAVHAGGTTVLTSAAPGGEGPGVRVLRDGAEVARIPSYAEHPVLTPAPRLTTAGARDIPCAVLLPTWYGAGDGPLPVLMDPYGGPHGQRVHAARNPYLTPQWFADQGFAVIVADGRGTPGRSPAWEKAVRDDFTVTLDDQVDALHALAASGLPLDLGRVAIRGWSYGGYLAALAVLRRPDVFHAGIAGAPVSDFRLYDTHYTERYLGDPREQPAVYAENSLVTEDGLTAVENPARPLMIIHGLADDNVVVAHALRLSSALLAAGREHEVLPLSGVTHMTPQEQVAENLLLLQVDFLKRRLGNGGGGV
jgi:dipeptidyl-peptidase 4